MIGLMNSYSHRFDYFFGWRYLLSPAFREQMRLKWGRTQLTRMLCYAGIICSLMISSALAILVLLAGWYLANG